MRGGCCAAFSRTSASARPRCADADVASRCRAHPPCAPRTTCSRISTRPGRRDRSPPIRTRRPTVSRDSVSPVSRRKQRGSPTGPVLPRARSCDAISFDPATRSIARSLGASQPSRTTASSASFSAAITGARLRASCASPRWSRTRGCTSSLRRPASGRCWCRDPQASSSETSTRACRSSASIPSCRSTRPDEDAATCS